jgi:aminoglycoside phosphotransferase
MQIAGPNRAFSFIPADHPFRPCIDALNAACVPSPGSKADRLPTELRKLMRVRRRHGAWQLKWAYVSAQSSGPDGDGFTAETVVYTSRLGRIDSYTFPQDSLLLRLAGIVARAGGPRLRILRYIPRRRLTFRVPAREDAPALIGKAMRPPEVERTYATLLAVSGAAVRSEASFRLPAPCGVDVDRAIVLQRAMPGRPLAELLSEANYRGLLRRAGYVHRELHELDVPGLETRDEQFLVDRLTGDLDCVGFFHAGAEPLLHDVSRLLFTRMPRPSVRKQAFLHGDFTVAHVLADDEAWSVIDFDAAAYGDPYPEIATFIARLKRGAPLFRERSEQDRRARELVEDAADAYLCGYQERAGAALDGERLLWHRIAAEVHVLARLIQRDLVEAGSFDSALALIDDLRKQLTRARASSLRSPMRHGWSDGQAATELMEQPS